MSDYQATCLLKNAAAAKALFDAADAKGMSRSLSMNNWREYPWARIRDGHINGFGNKDSIRECDLQEFLELVSNYIPPPPPIAISMNGMQYTVEFPTDYDGIKVGCTKVPTTTVDEIHKRLHAK